MEETRVGEEIELSKRGTRNEGYDDDYDETTHLIDTKTETETETETPKTSASRETLRPKKWDILKTPKLEKNISNAWKVIEENFPDLDKSKKEEIILNINENDEIMIKGDWSNAVAHVLFDYDDGNVNKDIPQKMKKILGEPISKKGLRERLLLVKRKKEQLKKYIKKMEDSNKEKDDELEKKQKDKRLRDQMADIDMEEAKNEISKITEKKRREKFRNREKKISGVTKKD